MNGWSIVTQSLSGEMHFPKTKKPEMVDRRGMLGDQIYSFRYRHLGVEDSCDFRLCRSFNVHLDEI